MRALDLELLALNVLGLGLISCIRYPIPRASGRARGRGMVSEATRHVMQANKSKNTKPELKVRAALRAAGLPGYRLHWKAAPGKPDICYPGRKVAIFVNGCFWHRCPYCALSTPKTNVEFWTAKFERNRARDQRDCEELANAGWTVVVIWECRLKKGRFDATMDELVRIVRAAGQDEPSPWPPRSRCVPAAPDLAWPATGRVIEIGSAPARLHRQRARMLRRRH